MRGGGIQSQWRQVFNWQLASTPQWSGIAAAALGMAAPVAAGLAMGHSAIGFATALGALAATVEVEPASGLFTHCKRELVALLPVLLAGMSVMLLIPFGRGWEIGMLPLVVLAGAMGGYSRPAANATTRFVLFLQVLAAGSLVRTPLLLPAILLGAVWTSALSYLFFSVVPPTTGQEAPPRPVTHRQLSARWKRVMAQWPGWNYTLRLAAGIAVSVAAITIWPGHHLHWIGVTVVLLTPRQTDEGFIRLAQRVVGTLCGVGLAGLMFWPGPPEALLVVMMGGLAGARAATLSRNYLAYSVCTTPLIIVIIDMGMPPETWLLADRILATLAGAAVVMLAAKLMPSPTLRSG